MKIRLCTTNVGGILVGLFLSGLVGVACRPLELGSNGELESSEIGGTEAMTRGGSSGQRNVGTGGVVYRTHSATLEGGASSSKGQTTRAAGGATTSLPVLSTGGTTVVATTVTGGTTAVRTVPPCVDGELSIRGRITLPNQRPLSGVTVNLTGSLLAQTLTDSEGRYEFNALCSGSYDVTPQSATVQFCTPSASLPDLAENVDEDFTGSPGGCKAAEYRPRVLVVTFDPWVSAVDQKTQVRLSKRWGWSDPTKLVPRFRRAIESATLGHVRYEIVKTLMIDEFPVKRNGIRYDEQSYADCMTDHARCFEPDTADYATIVAQHELCDKSNVDGYDEVWFLGAPYFGFPAVTRVGDVTLNGNPAPVVAASCFRVTSITGFNYERDLQDMLRVFHKRAEETLAFGLGGYQNNRMQTRLDQFAMVAAFSPDYRMSGCGSAYIPLNSSVMDDYGNRASVPSFCDDYLPTPLTHTLGSAPVLTNCSAWGCTGLGYHRFVLSRFPTGPGLASDGTMADFYRYTVNNERLFSTEAVTCSSTYADGWCARLTDGAYGTCNANEWATLKQSTGWVEFTYPIPKTVQSVTLYDRACVERVTRGHLEFSDGSSPIEFKALEGTGKTPTVVTFAPKQLSWMRVVIDESTGGENVGFGEVVVQ